MATCSSALTTGPWRRCLLFRHKNPLGARRAFSVAARGMARASRRFRGRSVLRGGLVIRHLALSMGAGLMQLMAANERAERGEVFVPLPKDE